MAYDANVLRRATARLEEARSRRAEEQERQRAQVYARCPRVAEIDRELRRTIVDIISASLKNGSDPVPSIQVVRDRNLDLQRERAGVLQAAGYPPDILDDKPACPRCGDTGWRGNQMCDCLRDLCAREQITALSDLLGLGEQSFDSFSLDYYSTQLQPSMGVSPRENMELVYEVCLNYAQKFGKFYFNNLLLTGGTGLGKTFLSACIARVVAENGFSVVYDSAGSIFARFEAQKFSRDPDDTRDARDETRRYLNCDLLIMDDLGSELTTPFVQSALYQVVNERLVSGRRTVISTSLSLDDIRKRYTPQIASRLEGEYMALHFYGEDIRLLKKQRM
jgi:DNA replication protein DnaC